MCWKLKIIYNCSFSDPPVSCQKTSPLILPALYIASVWSANAKQGQAPNTGQSVTISLNLVTRRNVKPRHSVSTCWITHLCRQSHASVHLLITEIYSWVYAKENLLHSDCCAENEYTSEILLGKNLFRYVHYKLIPKKSKNKDVKVKNWTVLWRTYFHKKFFLTYLNASDLNFLAWTPCRVWWKVRAPAHLNA